jgi:hypothetical protein
MSSLALFIFTAGFSSLYNAWRSWRYSELRRIRELAQRLVIDGYLRLPGTPAGQKDFLWRSFIFPYMFSHWKSVLPEFDLNNELTWPRPENGRQYNSNYTKPMNCGPKIISDSYNVQAVICYFFDSTFTSVHFGDQTHWKVRMLIAPTCVLFPWLLPGDASLQGIDEAWHIVNWPNPNRNPGDPIPLNAHIDAGWNGIYSNGVPCSQQLGAELTVEERMIAMAMHQIAIVLHSDTPGRLTPLEGSTGLYRGSHISVLEAIHQHCALPENEIKPIDWKRFAIVLKSAGEQFGNDLSQLDIDDSSCVLMLGSMLHTAM